MFESHLTPAQKRNSLLLSLVIALVVVGLMAGSDWFSYRFRTPDLLGILSNEINDRFMVWRNSSPRMQIFDRNNTHVVVVGIDEPSVKELGIWPWDRRLHSALISRLTAAGAKVIAFDVLFIDRTDPAADEELARAVAANPGVVLAALDYQDSSGDYFLKLPLRAALEQVVEPGKIRSVFERCGAVAVNPDKDRVVRKTRVVIPRQVFGLGFEGEDLEAEARQRGSDVDALPGDFYSYDILAAALAMDQSVQQIGHSADGSRLEIGPMALPVHKRVMRVNFGMYQMQFVGRAGQDKRAVYPFFDEIPYVEALMSMPEADLAAKVKGKVVLVGSTLMGMPDLVDASQVANLPFDIKSTPLGAMPGVHIHANVIESIMQRRFLREIDPWAVRGLIVVIGLVLGLALSRMKFFPGVVFTLLLAGLLLFGAYGLFVGYGYLLDMAGPIATPFFCLLGLSVYHRRIQEQDKQEIKTIFGQYLSPKVVDTLVNVMHQGLLGLEGKKEKVTIFYSDIRGFTTMSEKLAPEQVVALLNEYFEAVTAIAKKHDAYIDKFIGDCMMAVFSAPVTRPDDARRAVVAAWEMMRETERLQSRFSAQGRPTFTVGMGLNTGEVILGNIGSRDKRDYTVIGDNVNLAARLYAVAKGGQILISQSTYDEVRDLIEVQALEPIMVKGKAQPVTIYEITGLK